MAYLVQGGAPPDDSVTTVKIKDASVTAAKLGTGAVETAKIAAEAVTAAKVSSDVPQMGRNLIINGDMRIAQRGTSFAAVANGLYTLDRWKTSYVAGEQAVTITQDTDVPSEAFINSIKVDCTTVETTVASGDFFMLQHRIEGLNAAVLGSGTSDNATATLSFWVKSTKIGTFGVSLQNGAQDRSYVAEYTVNVTDTWEKKSVTFAADTTGTWLKTNGIGFIVNFPLLCGSTYQDTAGTWEAGAGISTSNQVNALDNTANNFYLTGVQLEVGSVATDFEHRDYASELARCQRYYVRLSGATRGYGNALVISSTRSDAMIHLPTTMRATPTVAESNSRIYSGGSYDVTAVGSLQITQNTVNFRCTHASGPTVSNAAQLQDDGGGGYLEFAAEL